MYKVAMPTIQHPEGLNKVAVSITSVVVHKELSVLDMNFIDVVKQIEVVLDRIQIEKRDSSEC